jgi:cytochrome c5
MSSGDRHSKQEAKHGVKHNATHNSAHDGAHPAKHGGAHEESGESFIKTPQQLIVVVTLALVLPIIIIMLLANYVVSGKRPNAGADAGKAESVAARIQPVAGHVLKVPGDLSKMKGGQEVYNANCAACHKEGVAGAPKFGDTAAWAPRLKSSFDTLWNSALKGKGSMAAQGGGDWDDIEVGRAVAYMANAAGGKFEDPKAAPASAPLAGAPAAAGAAPAAAAAVVIPAAAAAPVAAAGNAGKALVEGACAVCHAANGNFPGSPKLGDKAAWEPRIKTGVAALVASVTNGKGAMPPKGGSSASDADLKAAVEYMVAAAK